MSGAPGGVRVPGDSRRSPADGARQAGVSAVAGQGPLEVRRGGGLEALAGISGCRDRAVGGSTGSGRQGLAVR